MGRVTYGLQGITLLLVLSAHSRLANAQIVERQKEIIDQLLSTHMFSGTTTFGALKMDLNKDEVSSLERQSTWELFTETGTYGFCTVQTQQKRRSFIRRVSYSMAVKVVGLSQDADNKTRTWHPVFNFRAETEPANKDFRPCVKEDGGNVSVGLASVDFGKLQGYSNGNAGSAKALVSQSAPPLTSLSAFVETCFRFEEQSIGSQCSMSSKALGKKHAVEHVVRPPLQPTLPTNTDFYYIAYESETILIELVTAIALSMELALVASILHKYRRLRPFEWFLICVVVLSTLFTASFSVWQTFQKLSPIRAGWMSVVMTELYLTSDAGRVLEMVGDVFLVKSSVDWVAKLVVLPVIIVAGMVLIAIVALIYRRMRRFNGVPGDNTQAEVDEVFTDRGFGKVRRSRPIALEDIRV